jgi:hypothetical protein
MITQAVTVEKLGRKGMIDTSITGNYIACLAIRKGIGFGCGTTGNRICAACSIPLFTNESHPELAAAIVETTEGVRLQVSFGEGRREFMNGTL